MSHGSGPSSSMSASARISRIFSFAFIRPCAPMQIESSEHEVLQEECPYDNTGRRESTFRHTVHGKRDPLVFLEVALARSRIRPTIANLVRDPPRCVLDCLGQARNGFSRDGRDRSCGSEAGLDLALAVEDGSAHAARAQAVLLIIHGIAQLANALELLH